MSNQQRCGQCGVLKALEDFELDGSGCLRKSCRRCLRRARRRVPTTPLNVAPLMLGFMVPRNQEVEENLDWQLCATCQRLKDRAWFDLDQAGNYHLSCRDCLAGVDQGPGRAHPSTPSDGPVVGVSPNIDHWQQPALSFPAPIGRPHQTVVARSLGIIVEGQGRQCTRCRRDKALGEFDLDPNGIPRKTCKSCLLSVRNLRLRNSGTIKNGPRLDVAQDHPLPSPELAEGNAQPIMPEAELEQAILHVPSPFAAIEHRDRWTISDLGCMQGVCSACNALHWTKEKTRDRDRAIAGAFESCCKCGEVKVERLQALPEPLNTLMMSQDGPSRSFRQNLHHWNSLYAFTLIRFNMDDRPAAIGDGFQLFQVHGAVYHQQGPLHPAVGQDALYSQMYLYDPAYAAQVRSTRAPELDAGIITSLTQMLQEISPFIHLYLTARERFEQQAGLEPNLRIILDPQLRLMVETGADLRRENLPTANEVAMILPDEYGRAGF
ncbi:hypothetical protein HOY80DRAFT_1088989 [Tuber brumale]|nr:hypothetical protein HOY80DRAFT_1088989 [Tuber brumale]